MTQLEYIFGGLLLLLLFIGVVGQYPEFIGMAFGYFGIFCAIRVWSMTHDY